MCSYGKLKVSDKTIQREFTAIRTAAKIVYIE